MTLREVWYKYMCTIVAVVSMYHVPQGCVNLTRSCSKSGDKMKGQNSDVTMGRC